MFSGFAVYIGDRIVCMLREHVKSPQDNGMWLVLSGSANPADAALREEFPSLRPIELLGGKISHWLVIPSDSPIFEQEAYVPAIYSCITIRDSAGFRSPDASVLSNK